MIEFIKNHKVITGLSIVIILLIASISFETIFDSRYLSYGDFNGDAIDVSIINLIATPEKYDGKLVRVIGICNIEFEANGIYLSTEDYKKGNNSIWIDPDYEVLQTTKESLKRLNGKYVLIEGVFNHKVGMNRHFGSIMKISRYQQWY
jgi:hypothetical protein